MLHRVPRSTTLSLLCAAAVVAACSKGDSSADSARMADSMAAAAASAPAAMAPAPAPMTDANVFAMLDFDNRADSAGGSAAVAKGTDAGVKEFGRMMMKDHHMMHEEGMALAKKLGVTPELPASAAADTAKEKSDMEAMTAMAKGMDWDKAYIEHNIAGHEKVLAFIQTSANTTTNAELKAMLEKAAPKVQGHLDKAKAWQAKMGGMPAMGGDTSMKKP